MNLITYGESNNESDGESGGEKRCDELTERGAYFAGSCCTMMRGAVYTILLFLSLSDGSPLIELRWPF